MILESTKLEAHQLVSHFNSRVSAIQYTATVSEQEVDFLDLTVYKGDRFETHGILDVSPFCKAIDPRWYPHFTSAHHISIKTGVLRGEFVRTLRSHTAQIQGIRLNKNEKRRGGPADLSGAAPPALSLQSP